MIVCINEELSNLLHFFFPFGVISFGAITYYIISNIINKFMTNKRLRYERRCRK